MPTGYVIADGKGNAGQVLTSQGTSSPASWASYSAGALGYYGSFYDTSTSFAAVANTPYQIPLSTTAESNGVSISANNMVFAYGGTYSITISVQLDNSDSSDNNVTVWFKKNGSDLANSSSVISVPKAHGTGDGTSILTVNFIFTVLAGDAIGTWWSSEAGGNKVSVVTLPTIGAPTSPAFVATAAMVTYVQNPSQTFDYGKSICAAQGWFMP